MLPLAGVTVVALEQAVAAPFATRQLADLGARVIKIERPVGGDFARGYDEAVLGLSSNFVWLNRSKESLTLDLKHAAAPAILTALLDRADVFIQNLAPGASDRLGLSADTLTARYPRLIVCGISGYGTSGPYRDKKAYDLLVQCETGVLSLTGTPDTPAKAGIAVADIAAGMYAYSGILTALYARERTGRGTALEVSMFEALGEWMGHQAYYTAYSGQAPARTGAHHATVAPYGPFRCGDGKTVFLGLQNSREWVRFCAEVLEQPALTEDVRFDTNSKRVANRDVLHEVIEACFAGLSAAGVIARLDAAGIANARLNSVQEFWDHPQLQARDRWREVESEAGPLRALRTPVNAPDTVPRMDPIPALGAHTEAILQSLGYDDAAIARLRSEGAI
ncbi:MAG TPA: CaiB/BaiF CoA-transferase family protein [Chloroflexia bacterium]|nr:CaiB/BaiF CoA-transferase family protein [Chloroflexia bacterium]